MEIEISQLNKIRKLALDYFLKNADVEAVKGALESIEKAQEVLAHLNRDDDGLTAIKAGTIMLLSICSKFSEGKYPFNYTRDDWADIADDIAKYAVLADGKSYTISIFSLYAEYIDASVRSIADRVPAESAKEIRGLAEQLRSETERFMNGEMKEPDYTEDALWICLEAIVKIMSATAAAAAGRIAGEEMQQLIDASARIAFEYCRLNMYKREQLLITGYLENQRVLDQKLEKQYIKHLEAVELEAESFNDHRQKAFSDDPALALQGAIGLADECGTDPDELLLTEEDADDFFLN